MSCQAVVAHPLIPALRRQRQADLCDFEASLVYRAGSRTARAVTQRNPVLVNINKNPFVYGYFVCRHFCVLHDCMMPMKARGCQNPWNWSNRWL